MSEPVTPHPEEEHLLGLWRLAEDQVAGIDKAERPEAWQRAAADAWRAQMAYRDASHARLLRDQEEERLRRQRPVGRRRSNRSRAARK